MDKIVELRHMREFLYYLDGKYYIIGRHECDECQDERMIKDYEEYYCLTDRIEFKMNHLNDIDKCARDKIAEIYEKIQNACYVPVGESKMNIDKVILRESIESIFKDEIAEQVDRWLKADVCLTLKKGDKILGI